MSTEALLQRLQAVESQKGVLIFSQEGKVVASSGDLQQSTVDSVALFKLILLCTQGVIASVEDEPETLESISIGFKNYQYAVSISTQDRTPFYCVVKTD
jgi:hypothetical protein